MASTYVNDLRLEEIGTGEKSGSWGTVTNTNLELISEAFSYGSEAIANASTHTITVADGASDEARSLYLKCTGGGQACTVTLAPNTLSKVWIIENATSYTLTFSQGTGANVAVLAGQVKMIATDGAGNGAIVYDLLTDVNLAGTTTAATLTASGVITGAGLLVADAGTIGSASDTDAMSISSNGSIVMSGATVTVSGALGVAGETTLSTHLNMGDNDIIKLGAGSDLQLYHDSSNSYVQNAGVGVLVVKSAQVNVTSASDENMASFVQNGAVTLYHDNVSKLATASTGVDIASSSNTQLTVTSTSGIGSIEVGSAASNQAFIDLKTPTSDDYDVRLTSNSGGAGGSINIAGGTFAINGSAEVMATFTDDGAVSLYHDNAVKLATASGGVNVTGTLTATTEVTVSSDVRFKSNIETIDSALDKVKAMRGVYFDKKDKRSVGVIAQEMQEVMPEVVVTDDTEDKHLSVAYGNLVGVLIEAVKELSEEVSVLRNNVQTIKFEDS